MKQYTLFGRPNSGSLAVQVALEEIGLPYERVWVDAATAAGAFRATVCPTGKVPALALPDGTIVFESAAILIHLALAHPEAQLAPHAGTSPHARFLQWMVFLSANVYEAVLRMYYSDRYSARGAADGEAVRAQAATDYLRDLELLSLELKPWVLGADYSIADVYLYMLVSWCPDKAALYAKLPALAHHAERVAARPALVRVEAEQAAIAVS